MSHENSYDAGQTTDEPAEMATGNSGPAMHVIGDDIARSGSAGRGSPAAEVPRAARRQNTVTIDDGTGNLHSPGMQHTKNGHLNTIESNDRALTENSERDSSDGTAQDESHGHAHRGLSEKAHDLRQRVAGKRHSSHRNSRDANGPARRSTDRSSSSAPGQGFLQRIKTGLSEPRPKFKKEPTWRASGFAILKASWLNVLLVFIPVSWALHFANVNDTIVFVMAFLAIIPLAKLLGFATEELSLRVGQTIGGLLNATLGNAVELIVAILALIKCELQIVQSSLLGSILSNLLLVLGMCFFVGGLKFSEQSFGETGAQINSSLLVISVIAILIPAGFFAAFSSTLDVQTQKTDVLAMSRGAAVIVIVIYFAYMIFQLWSHPHLFADEGAHAKQLRERKVGKHRMFRQTNSDKRAAAVTAAGHANLENGEGDEEEEEEEVPSINLWATIVLLLAVTVLVGVTAEWLVDSINGLTEGGSGISQQWVGLILLPIVGNAAEHVTAVTVAYKNKLDLSLSVAVGSSIQIALFVIPLLVILAWILGKPLSLLFDPFESITLFLSVLLANYTMQDSRSNWLEGWLLMNIYLLIAVAFWYYPAADTPEQRLLVC